MENDASSYIADMAIEQRKIAIRAELTTSVFRLDMLIFESRTIPADGVAREMREQHGR